jgi:CBS domain-containing protein
MQEAGAMTAEQAVAQFLDARPMYELMPAHGKVVTLDADLPVKHALDALASHGATCLPVWDSYQQRFVDVFTCTDLVDVVLFTHRALAAGGGGGGGAAGGEAGGGGSPSRADAQQAIERCQLRDLHGLKRSKPSGFVMASVDDSMYHGCNLLKQHRLECLPLGDSAASSSLLHLLLPEQLLAYVASSEEFRQGSPQLFAASLAQAVLPQCAAPRTVAHTATLADALLVLAEERLAALPVLDAGGGLCDVLSTADVRHLATLSQARARPTAPPAAPQPAPACARALTTLHPRADGRLDDPAVRGPSRAAAVAAAAAHLPRYRHHWLGDRAARRRRRAPAGLCGRARRGVRGRHFGGDALVLPPPRRRRAARRRPVSAL